MTRNHKAHPDKASNCERKTRTMASSSSEFGRRQAREEWQKDGASSAFGMSQPIPKAARSATAADDEDDANQIAEAVKRLQERFEAEAAADKGTRSSNAGRSSATTIRDLTLISDTTQRTAQGGRWGDDDDGGDGGAWTIVGSKPSKQYEDNTPTK